MVSPGILAVSAPAAVHRTAESRLASWNPAQTLVLRSQGQGGQSVVDLPCNYMYRVLMRCKVDDGVCSEAFQLNRNLVAKRTSHFCASRRLRLQWIQCLNYSKETHFKDINVQSSILTTPHPPGSLKLTKFWLKDITIQLVSHILHP